MLGDFASLDVQNTYRGSDAYEKQRDNSSFKLSHLWGVDNCITTFIKA
ncbi:hypothetical protein [Piscirickettsia salmonis]|nr:hypothetical protein [Piscirickettsia salmonis]